MLNLTTITHKAAQALAERLARPRGGHTLAASVAVLEQDAATAGRLIGVLLRATHSSDEWQLPEVQL